MFLLLILILFNCKNNLDNQMKLGPYLCNLTEQKCVDFEKKIVKRNLTEFYNNFVSTNKKYRFKYKYNTFYTITDVNNIGFNKVLSSYYDVENIDKNLKKICNEYDEQKLNFSWYTNDSDLPIIKTKLKEQGLKLYGTVPGMILSIKDLELSDTLDNKFSISQVKNKKDMEDWMKPFRNTYNLSQEASDRYKDSMENLIYNNLLINFIAKENDIIIGASSIFLGTESIGIYNCVTLKEFRRKGILSLLINKMLYCAVENKYDYITLQASTLSKNIFKKYGFETIVPYEIF